MSAIDAYAYNETSEFIVELSDTIIPFIPPYPGSANITAGSQNSAISQLDDKKLNKTEAVTLDEFALVKESATTLRQDHDSLSGNVAGLTQDLQVTNGTVSALSSQVAGLNLASTTDVSINDSGEIVYGYSDGSETNFGFFPAPKGYRGTATATPTVAGLVGEFFLNSAANASPIGWWCVTPNVANASAWVARGVDRFGGLAGYFPTNTTIKLITPSAGTFSTPVVKSVGTPAVAWTYSANGTTGFATAVFPLAMAEGSVLMGVCTGLTGVQDAAVYAKRTA